MMQIATESRAGRDARSSDGHMARWYGPRPAQAPATRGATPGGLVALSKKTDATRRGHRSHFRYGGHQLCKNEASSCMGSSLSPWLSRSERCLLLRMRRAAYLPKLEMENTRRPMVPRT